MSFGMFALPMKLQTVQDVSGSAALCVPLMRSTQRCSRGPTVARSPTAGLRRVPRRRRSAS